MEGYFPGKKYGGPPVSVDNFCKLLESVVECFIVTHNHDLGEKTPYDGITDGWNNRGNAKVLYLSDIDYQYDTFERIVEEIHPDYMYLQGLFQNCIIPCLKLAKRRAIKVVLASRGELCSGAFKKKYKKIPYIIYLRRMGLVKDVLFQSTSEEESIAIAKYLGVSSERIYLLDNIPSIPLELPDHAHKEPGVGLFVFISRILWKKNLLKAINCLKGVKGKVTFDIYGPKEDVSYWKQCEEAINTLSNNIKVEYKGVLSHDVIHETFRKYDAFLLPTLSENYGHVIAESLVSGCIPIISDQTPWNDINEAAAGWALTLDNPKLYEQAIQEVIDMDDDKIREKRDNIANYIKKKLNLKGIQSNYLKVFK